MSLASILLQTYISSEESGLVDNVEDIFQKTVLLPIYHSNKRSDGKNIFQISLDKEANAVEGEFLQAEYELSDKEKISNYIIYPVTGDSVTRSSGPSPHPIVDELKYLAPVEEKRMGLYIDLLGNWLEYEENIEVKSFLKIIYDYIDSGKITEDIINFISKGRESKYNKEKQVLEVFEEVKEKVKSTKYNLATTTITFEIIGFKDYENISVTNYKELHKSYIKFQDYLNKDFKKEICNISGKNLYCSPKHRGMMGNAKIIGGSHSETHIGRFQKVDDVIKVGFETSNKIHNLLKYLLENRKNSIRMSGSMDGAKLLIWFSDDVSNEREINILSQGRSFGEFEENEEKNNYILDGDYTKDLLFKAKGSYKDLGDKENKDNIEKKIEQEKKVYIIILDKVSNGRISIKYFYQGLQRDFYKNMEKWYKTFSWYFYNSTVEKFTLQSPNLYRIVDTVYGIELNGRLSMPDNKSKVKENLLTSLIPCIIEGKPIPMGMVKQAFENIKGRQRYKKSWSTVMAMSCAVLRKYKLDYKKREVMDLLDMENTDRNYVYGRILALLEYMEERSLGEVNRLTNVDRLWNSYINSPGKTLKVLIEKGKPYWNRLKKNNYGLFVNKQKELQECFDLLEQGGEENKNVPLNEDFVFGYYAQRKELFTKKDRKEGE